MTDEREGGYLKLWRRIESWPYYRDLKSPAAANVIMILLLMANWKRSEVWVGRKKYIIEPGQILASEEAIAKRAKTTRRVVRRVLCGLAADRWLSRCGLPAGITGGRTSTLLTIHNWSEYQTNEGVEVQTKGQEGAKPGPNQGQTRAPSKEGKEEEEGKEQDLSVASLPPAASRDEAAASPLERLAESDQLNFLARPAKAEGEEGAQPPANTTPPPLKLPKKTTPQGEAFDFWKAQVWPKLSTAPCPKPTSAEMVQLDRRCKELGLSEITAAMQRAEQDPYWHEKLDLLTFCQKISRFLPRTEGPPDGKGALPVSDFSSEADRGYTGRRNFQTGEYLDADDPCNAEWKARRTMQ